MAEEQEDQPVVVEPTGATESPDEFMRRLRELEIVDATRDDA